MNSYSNKKNFSQSILPSLPNILTIFTLILSSKFLNTAYIASHSNNIADESKFDSFQVAKIHHLIEHENWTCVDIVNYFMRRSLHYNPLLNALINYNSNALKEAHELDIFYNRKQKNDGQKFMGPLHCVPFVVKDIIDVSQVPTTGGIRALRHSVPNKDALVVDRLRRAGAIIVSKANLAELAVGEEYISEMGGECHNPFDLRRTCGASSSGSAAAISAAFSIIGSYFYILYIYIGYIEGQQRGDEQNLFKIKFKLIVFI